MKKYLLTAGVVFGMALASYAQASSSLTISGTVAAINTLTIASQSGYNALNLTAGATAQVVGIATETSNDYLGYKVTLNSANAGSTAQAFLKGSISGNTNSVVNYSITYGGAAVTLSGGNATVTSAAAPTAAAGVAKNIAVTFAGSWLPADTYSDTLKLTIAGN